MRRFSVFVLLLPALAAAAQPHAPGGEASARSAAPFSIASPECRRSFDSSLSSLEGISAPQLLQRFQALPLGQDLSLQQKAERLIVALAAHPDMASDPTKIQGRQALGGDRSLSRIAAIARKMEKDPAAREFLQRLRQRLWPQGGPLALDDPDQIIQNFETLYSGAARRKADARPVDAGGPGPVRRTAALSKPVPQAARSREQVPAAQPPTPGPLSALARARSWLLGHPEQREERVRRYQAESRSRYEAVWREASARTPESLNGLKTDSALRLLGDLDKDPDPFSSAQPVQNGTFFRSLGDGQAAVLKRLHRRSDMGEGRISAFSNFSNSPRMEVLAFALDRLFGMNLTPPAVMLHDGSIAQLKIRAAQMDWGDAQGDASRLLEASHLQALDMIMGNIDRGKPGNLLADGTKLVAIDWDLSSLKSLPLREAVQRNLPVSNALIAPENRVWRRGAVPGFYRASVLRRLKAADADAVQGAARQAQVPLTHEEAVAIASRAGMIADVVEGWARAYGRERVILDDRP